MFAFCQSDSNRPDCNCCADKQQSAGASRIAGRAGFLFAAAIIAVIAGFAFPRSAHIFDVSFIFCASLTAAMLMVAFSARSVLQVLGFPSLIVLATMLRLALSTASAKIVFSHGDAGTIVDLIGKFFFRNNCVLATLVFIGLVAVIFAIICKYVNSINRASINMVTDISPARKQRIEDALGAGFINDSSALNLKAEVAREMTFFIAIAGASRFVLYAAAIELAIVVVNIVASITVAAVPPAAATATKASLTLAVGAGTITHLLGLVAAAACGSVTRKSYAATAEDTLLSREFTGRIKVVATEVPPCRTDQIQYQNPPAVAQFESAERFDDEPVVLPAPVRTTNDTFETSTATPQQIESSDKHPAQNHNQADSNLCFWPKVKKNQYGPIAELIAAKNPLQTKTILMAAENAATLGVTVPVNIAMRLVKKGRRSLLIDLDLQRNAAAKAFDIDAADSNDKMQPIPTCIDNLSIWPACYFRKSDVTTLKKLIPSLQSGYDHLIVYSPNIKLIADWDSIAECFCSAMLFGSDNQTPTLDNLCKLLESRRCDILKPQEILPSASCA